jgi:hypothetical protein
MELIVFSPYAYTLFHWEEGLFAFILPSYHPSWQKSFLWRDPDSAVTDLTVGDISLTVSLARL